MEKKYILALFEEWMKVNHPNYYIISGSLIILLAVMFLASIILPFFVVWWWKLMLFSIGSSIILRGMMVVYLTEYMKEFQEYLRNKKIDK